jgi:hypothetical protein
MKLKTLALIVAVLAVLSAGTWYLQRPAPEAPADPRVGQSFLPAALLSSAAKLVITTPEGAVTLAKGTGDRWSVPSYYDFPADMPKLIRLVDTLQEAKLERLVTTNPSYIARLGFGDTRIAIQDTGGKEIWGLSLGKLADRGGTFIQFSGETKAFLGNFTAYLDANAGNWADHQLVELKADTVAAVEINFPEEDNRNVRFARTKAGEAFTTDGFAVRQDLVNNLVNLHTSVSYNDTEEPDSAGAKAAQPRSRTVKLTTFDGHSVTLTYSQKAEPKVETPPDQGEVVPPPQPVYLSVVDSNTAAPVNGLMRKRSFRVSESLFTNLPAKTDDLVDRPPPPPASLNATPAPAAPTSGPASGFRLPGK